jgi:hypothetical protein
MYILSVMTTSLSSKYIKIDIIKDNIIDLKKELNVLEREVCESWISRLLRHQNVRDPVEEDYLDYECPNRKRSVKNKIKRDGNKKTKMNFNLNTKFYVKMVQAKKKSTRTDHMKKNKIEEAERVEESYRMYWIED